MTDNTSASRDDRIRERILNGRVGSTVWWLSWPTIITMLLLSANVLIDAFFVGRLGPAALSGVGLTTQIMNFLMAVATVMSVGATALVARFVGAADWEGAKAATRQSILASIFVSILFGAAVWVLGPMVLTAMGARGDDLRLGTIYLSYLLVGIVPFFLMTVLTGVYRGLGDTVSPLLIMLAATMVSLVGDYVLIFGMGPIPAMGVAGAGTAGTASRLLATLLFLLWLPRTALRAARTGDWRPDFGMMRRIAAIGFPAGLQGALRTTSFMIFYAILRHTPEAVYASAALTVGLRVESLAFLPGFAFSVAATSMVGQSLGAGLEERAEKSAWIATWQSVAVTGLIGLAFVVFARPLSGLFTSDPHVLPLAAQYLVLNGVTEPFLGVAMVLGGAMQGAGETRGPAWATAITQWIIRLPLTYYLAVTAGLGALGAWISMSGTTAIGGIVMVIIFRRNRWKEVQL